jgi:hypothetical protein
MTSIDHKRHYLVISGRIESHPLGEHQRSFRGATSPTIHDKGRDSTAETAALGSPWRPTLPKRSNHGKSSGQHRSSKRDLWVVGIYANPKSVFPRPQIANNHSKRGSIA